MQVGPKQLTMAAKSDAKRRRLLVADIPDAKLARVLRLGKEHPDTLDGGIDRRTLSRDRSHLFEQLSTVVKLGEFELEHIDLAKALPAFCASGPWLTAMQQLWDRRPCSSLRPYHLLLYCDEAVPGNILRLDNGRKCMAYFCTIAESPPSVIQHECMWIPLAVLRTSVAKDVPSGFS
jgi:hypothetical protein